MSKVLTLDYENEHDYKLIGIHTTLEDYRLAYYLNTNLNIQLKRNSQDLDLGSKNNFFSLYVCNCNTTFLSWSLITNKYVSVSETDAVSTILFKENYQTSVLIQEKNKIDYFLKIEGDLTENEFELIIAKVNSIKHIITSYKINPQTLKSKDYLIF
tara:strand:- start:558041 stop:558508 length:468 start_codon:yes stop_codon:yes gene_type:complete